MNRNLKLRCGLAVILSILIFSSSVDQVAAFEEKGFTDDGINISDEYNQNTISQKVISDSILVDENEIESVSVNANIYLSRFPVK